MRRGMENIILFITRVRAKSFILYRAIGAQKTSFFFYPRKCPHAPTRRSNPPCLSRHISTSVASKRSRFMRSTAWQMRFRTHGWQPNPFCIDPPRIIDRFMREHRHSLRHLWRKLLCVAFAPDQNPNTILFWRYPTPVDETADEPLSSQYPEHCDTCVRVAYRKTSVQRPLKKSKMPRMRQLRNHRTTFKKYCGERIFNPRRHRPRHRPCRPVWMAVL